MRHVRSFALLASISLVACLSAACGEPRQPQTPTDSPSFEVDAKLGVGDFFKVRVYGEEDLGGQHQVGEDGTFVFPFLGRVRADGRTPEELAEALATALVEEGYLRSPQVSVLVEEYASKRVSVMGSVARPGTFPIKSGLTVVQAISLAGGLTSIANAGEIVLTRREDGKIKRVTLSVSRITRGADSDVMLRAGDLIYVPERVF